MSANSNTGPAAIAAVIVAAGRGERAGASAEGPKQYRRIAGTAVLARTLGIFLRHPAIARIVVVIHPDDDALFAAAVGDLPAHVSTVHGGATRQQSTLLGLRALERAAPDLVLIHDGVRPFVDAAMIDRVIAGADPHHGAIPALPVADTLKRAAADGTIAGTVDRSVLHAAQTPQAFPFDKIHAAHEAAETAGRSDFTDDAAIAEWAGMPVRLVAGSPDNTKITWAKDIALAEQRLAGSAGFPDVRTGNGYDVHSFEPGDHVTLCGVAIPYDMRLSGHSDADVALHAVTDALLGGIAEGDIGSHFPPSDPRWRDVASAHFLQHAAGLVQARGGRVEHVDLTIIGERPKIGPHREALRAGLAGLLALDPACVSVKATTTERLGFCGREEGLAAQATVSLSFAL